ncbi:phosphoenolpyruvate--protein phosphotransferase [Anaerofustis stercorihominis]|nr:phosphoenolpyruvate--protein phosphotransferase [Anaerofustis stercorihominis]MCR2032713.1 phosphoenolpyruvate--protein phosphotransferase [Anaerofustis stercorihominis]
MKGINASPGVAIGNVFLYVKEDLVVTPGKIEAGAVDAELKKLDDAIEKSRTELQALKEKTIKEIGEEEAEVFTAHMMFLDDPGYIGEAQNKIKNELIVAEQALNEITEMFVGMFGSMDDEYMKARAADCQDVADRILRHLLGIESADLSQVGDNGVIVAVDLTPSDTAQMNKDKVIGFAIDEGSRTSHSAIMARSLEVPAVVGLGDITSKVKGGEKIIVDGTDGNIIINPSDEEIKEYEAKKEAYAKEQAELAKLKDLASETSDGHKVELCANIGSPNDLEGANKYGADGVGLFRSEFLYMDAKEMPSEDVQYESYKKVLEGMGDRPVIIRTLDIGGDKKLPYLPMEEEMNPFLGVRAVRLCFQNVEMFKTQLRALLRASVYGNAHIMFPMISNVEEVRKAKGILEECKEELKAKGVEYDENIKVGIMIEIPSAAVTADIIAKEVDFFSIGTNDLCQYSLAVDRQNQNLSELNQPLSPAIIRLVKNVIDASHKAGIFTGMCGEMAGDPTSALLLLGLGLDEFSMSAPSILRAKKVIRSFTYEKAQEIAKEVLENAETQDEVKAILGKYLD